MNRLLSQTAVFITFIGSACSFSVHADELYFPPAEGEWETIEPSSVSWDKDKLQKALDYAGAHQSTGVVVLYQGKILAEQYWELTGENSAKFRQRLAGRDRAGKGIEDVASAQKSVASFLVGIAQQKGLLKIDDPVNQYLDAGWSRATPQQEKAITIRHLLTMTSGLTERGEFVAQPGTKFFYNTPVYAKTIDIIEAASKLDRHQITKKWLTEPVGMRDSKWASRGVLGTRSGNAFGFATTARDLARFGLLAQAEGKWGDNVVLSDQEYLKDATRSSQKLNPFYGYLWWVNENSYAAKSTIQTATAPADMYAAKGALNRRCFVVPSLKLVVTRLGDQPDVGRMFDRQLWKLLMAAAPE